MADIAAVFHWTPTTFDAMELDELMMWRQEANLRSQPED